MFSRAIYILCVTLMAYASFIFCPHWNKTGSQTTLSWDAAGYYWYLPSVFIYKDLEHQSFKDSIIHKYHPFDDEFQAGFQLPNGNYSMKYSSGMAFMYLPFFTVAHLLAKPLGYPADGFSQPYQFAVQFGALLISILGLWYLRKLLGFYYSDLVTGITILLLVFGSNYLDFAAIDNSLSHCWLFTVYVFILLNTHYFYTTCKNKYAVRIGLLVGLATLTRPTDCISILIPLLWGLESISFSAIKAKLAFFKTHVKAILLAGICAAAVVSIQLFYWKYVSGQWLVYSYENQGFSWGHPHIYLYGLSYRSGWLIYSPMMVFAIIGIIPFIRNGKNKVAILVFFALNYYIVSAWDIWWYGSRAMVQSYPVLLFPFASLAESILKKKAWLWLFAPAAALFLYFNVWITYHYHAGGLYDCDSMTNRYFWRVVGRWSAPEQTLILRDNAQLFEGQPKDMHTVYENGFEQDTGSYYTTQAIEGKQSLLLNKENQHSPDYDFAFSDKDDKWLRVQVTCRAPVKEWNTWAMAQMNVKLKGNGKVLKEYWIRLYRFLGCGDTEKIYLDMELPKADYDTLGISFNNEGGDKQLAIDNLKVWAFK